jgi:hypothetical protein
MTEGPITITTCQGCDHFYYSEFLGGMYCTEDRVAKAYPTWPERKIDHTMTPSFCPFLKENHSQ